MRKKDVGLLVEAGQALAYAICYSSEVRERLRSSIESFDEQLKRAIARRGLDMINQTGGVDKYIDVLKKYGFERKAEILAEDYNRLEKAAQEKKAIPA